MARHHPAGAAPPGAAPREPVTPGWPRWLAVTAFVICGALVTLSITYPNDHGQRIILAWVVSIPVVALRRWPLPVLGVVTVANALVMEDGSAPPPLGIILGLASYLAAARLPRRVSITAAAISAAALGGALIYADLKNPHAQIAAEAIQGFLPLAAGWFIGDSAAARRRYQAGLAEQARQRAEQKRAAEAERARQQVREERVRIARELHDVVAHTLAVITVQAGVGRRLMAKHPEQASAALESIETIGRTAQEELHVVLGLLRDEENRAAALVPAPRLVDVKELVETVRASGTPVDLRMSGTDRPLSPALELSVYRVVQEALTNVVKHAPGARAVVDLAVFDNVVHLDVTDDGAPQAPQAPPAPQGPQSPQGPPVPPGPAGHGIVGMRERITAFGGWLHAEPMADGRGFRVTAQVPVEGAA